MNARNVLLDAQRATKAAQDYEDLVREGLLDGRLEQSMQWSLTGFVAPVDAAVKKYTQDSILRFMRHMGEYTVPLWVFGTSKTANVYLRDMIKDAQKSLEKERRSWISADHTTAIAGVKRPRDNDSVKSGGSNGSHGSKSKEASGTGTASGPVGLRAFQS